MSAAPTGIAASTATAAAIDTPRWARLRALAASRAAQALAATLLGLGAFALGWLLASRGAARPDPATPPARQVAPATTGPATLKASQSAAPAASQAVPWPLWGFQLAQPIPEQDPPRTPLPWRMIGAGRSGAHWQLIVLRQGKTEPEFFGIGDKLPGGYRIEAISDEDVTLRQGRKTLILSYIGTQ